MKIGYHFKIKNHYSFGGDTNLLYKTNTGNVSKDIEQGSLKAALTADSLGKIKVNFWDIVEEDASDTSSRYVRSKDSADNFYFQIPSRKLLGERTYYLSFPYAASEVGAITIPFKYWKGSTSIPNNTSADFNAGVYIGRKWGRQRFYYDKDKNHESAAFTLALFAGPTKIDLTKDNAKDSLLFKQNSNELAISLGAGGMFSYRNFNVGLFAGFDSPLSKEGKNWIYSDRLWIGFGIGYSLGLLGSAK